MHVVICIIIISIIIICFASFRDSFFGLETVQQQLIIGSVVAATGILAFFARRSSEVKTIPLGDGWWGAGQKPASEDEAVHPFTIQASDREIQVWRTWPSKSCRRSYAIVVFFNRTCTTASTEPALLSPWSTVASSTASTPRISGGWCPTGGMSLTGRSRWRCWTRTHTSKPKSKVCTVLLYSWRVCFSLKHVFRLHTSNQKYIGEKKTETLSSTEAYCFQFNKKTTIKLVF